MDVKEAIMAGIKELILPEIKAIKDVQARADVSLAAINQRLDDVNQHLVDQSRRIDAVREELGARIDETNKRIDETNKRIDDTNKRIDTVRAELSAHINAVRAELGARIDETNKRIDAADASLGRLYEVIVRREEHVGLAVRVERLETEFMEFRKRLAA